ncbi:hypothetical protein SFUMM280S_09838 [Streptomyces fumanus]
MSGRASARVPRGGAWRRGRAMSGRTGSVPDASRRQRPPARRTGGEGTR